MVWPGFGFIWATLVTEATLSLGMVVGIRSWISVFKPARYFVLAYLAMAIPNMVGNLTKIGLIETNKNGSLFTWTYWNSARCGITCFCCRK
ncbi:7TM diverse intracellular signaling domain-containing protein [Pseudoalteromonas sp. S558]|uniref:7TM diverse intracellular signaling domain-containing protein n=1 Tax=Pseudoalteromonas sp. S558 TaxID=2066515 RepID=UPI0025A3C6C5|nr:7TM diverse intracellular signaling domain-containing protein [Pseudoalteromonas sp. S558]